MPKKSVTTAAPRRSTTRASIEQHQHENAAHVKFITYAALAGVCAACAGLCSKIGVSSAATTLVNVAAGALLGNGGNSTSTTATVFGVDTARLTTAVEYIVRVTLLLSNGTFTAQMWRYYLKALQLGPTPTASSVNLAANLLVTAAFGVVLLNETAPGPLWFVGAVIAGAGLLLITQQSGGEEKSDIKKKKA